MKTQIQKVESYQCPICKEFSGTNAEAEKCFLKCDKAAQKQTREKQRFSNWEKKMNQLRLEAETPEQVLELLVKYAKQHFGAVFEFSDPKDYTHGRNWFEFGSLSCSHSAPIGKKTFIYGSDPKQPTHFLGWSGWFNGEWKQHGRNPFAWGRGQVEGVTDLLASNGGFKGIHLDGCFNGGKNWSGGLMFFMDDFPKIKSKYEQFQELQAQKSVFSEQKALQNNKLNEFLEEVKRADSELQENIKKSSALSLKISELREQMHELNKEYDACFQRDLLYVESKRDIKFPIDKKYHYDEKSFETLSAMFKTGYMRR